MQAESFKRIDLHLQLPFSAQKIRSAKEATLVHSSSEAGTTMPQSGGSSIFGTPVDMPPGQKRREMKSSFLILGERYLRSESHD